MGPPVTTLLMPTTRRLVRAQLALAIVIAIPALAQSGSPTPSPAPPPPRRIFGFVGSFDGLTSQFRSRTGDASGLGSRGWGLGLNAAMSIGRIVVLGADVGGAWTGDDSSFTQSTTAGQKKSSTMTFLGSVFAGAKTPVFPLSRAGEMRAAIGVNTGMSKWSAVRSIDNCVDCRVDRPSLTGGRYIEPYVIIGKYNASAFAGLKVGYRTYLANESTARNVIFVGMGGVREGRRN